MHDYRGLMEHLDFISIRAMHDDFHDSAHFEYDMAVQRLAESIGFAAFSKAQAGLSVVYNRAQNMRAKPHKGSYQSLPKRNNELTKGGKKACFR